MEYYFVFDNNAIISSIISAWVIDARATGNHLKAKFKFICKISSQFRKKQDFSFQIQFPLLMNGLSDIYFRLNTTKPQFLVSFHDPQNIKTTQYNNQCAKMPCLAWTEVKNVAIPR